MLHAAACLQSFLQLEHCEHCAENALYSLSLLLALSFPFLELVAVSQRKDNEPVAKKLVIEFGVALLTQKKRRMIKKYLRTSGQLIMLEQCHAAEHWAGWGVYK